MRFIWFRFKRFFVAPAKTKFVSFDESGKDLIKVKVRRVLDGDTVEVICPSGLVRVRLDSIDCPEDGQEWGDNSRNGLIKLIGGRTVYLETHGIDIYDRTLATIYVMEGSELANVNERMVMRGHAWVMRHFYSHLSRGRQHQLNKLERWAQSKRVGLWRTANPVPPWQWRKESA